MEERQDFLHSFKPAIDLLSEHVEAGHNLRIITHADADGIASGGILCLMASRLGTCWKISCEKRLDSKTLRRIASEKNQLIIFSDFGSGYLELIGEHLPETDVLILDHHLPEEVEVERITQVNPMLHGIDGSRELAASGVCYMLANRVDDANRDLSPLGLLGAIGDQQDKGEKKSLLGLNVEIEEDASKTQLLNKQIDLIFYGYETRPIAKAIANTTTPFIPGLSGREDNCVALLKDVGIDLKRRGRWRALRDLAGNEKQLLFSALSDHMVSQGLDGDVVHDLIGTIYTFPREESWTPMRDCREYSSLLNACARMGRPSLGLCITIGDRDKALKEAEETLHEYRRKIGTYLEWVIGGGRIEELDNIYLLQGGDEIMDTLIGVVASIILSQGLKNKEKPILATANTDEGLMKVSGRSTETLLKRGLHLGRVLKEASMEVDGAGGGHDIAAGAYIPADKEVRFIGLVNELVQRNAEE
ncbi:MAG: DHHA1 domain-containing protein [Candidatus Bathyarchaeia archaeon]